MESDLSILKKYDTGNTLFSEVLPMKSKKKTAVAQIRMDPDMKRKVEDLYDSIGLSFAEAVRLFAALSLECGGWPIRTPKRNEAGFVQYEYIINGRSVSYEQAKEEGLLDEYFAAQRRTEKASAALGFCQAYEEKEKRSK